MSDASGPSGPSGTLEKQMSLVDDEDDVDRQFSGLSIDGGERDDDPDRMQSGSGGRATGRDRLRSMSLEGNEVIPPLILELAGERDAARATASGTARAAMNAEGADVMPATSAPDPSPPLALPREAEAPVAMTSAGLNAMQRMRSRPGPVFGAAAPHNLGADSNALSAPRGAWLGNRSPPTPRSMGSPRAPQSEPFAERPSPNALTSPRGGWLREMLVQDRQRGIEYVEDPTTPLYTQTTAGPTDEFRNARWRLITGAETDSNANTDARTVADSVARSQLSSSPGAPGSPRLKPLSSSVASLARPLRGPSLGSAFAGRDDVFGGVSHTSSGTSTGEVPRTPLSANLGTPALYVTQCSADVSADVTSAAAAAMVNPEQFGAMQLSQAITPDQPMADDAQTSAAAAPLDEATLAQVAATLHKISAESHVAAVNFVPDQIYKMATKEFNAFMKREKFPDALIKQLKESRRRSKNRLYAEKSRHRKRGSNSSIGNAGKSPIDRSPSPSRGSLGRPSRDPSDGSGDSMFERAMSARLSPQATSQMPGVKSELTE